MCMCGAARLPLRKSPCMSRMDLICVTQCVCCVRHSSGSRALCDDDAAGPTFEGVSLSMSRDGTDQCVCRVCGAARIPSERQSYWPVKRTNTERHCAVC